MPSIRTLSAGVVPVFHSKRPGEDPLFLLLRAFKYWDFPKGLVEKGESSQAAALRELAEEAGIRSAEFLWGNDYYDTNAYAGNKVARYYLASVSDREVKIGKNPVSGIYEHHEFRWCTYPEARELLGKRVALVLEWAEARLIDRNH